MTQAPLSSRLHTARDHRVELESGWSLWRSVCLRSAGFPVDMLDALSAPWLDAGVEQCLSTEGRFEILREAATTLCRDQVKATQGDERRLWSRARRHAAKGRPPDASTGNAEADSVFAQMRIARRAADDTRQQLSEGLSNAWDEIWRATRELAADERIREALAWQSRSALAGFDAVLRKPTGARGSKSRQLLVASYTQRYCAKNESIGFFGPVGWGEFEPDGPAIRLQPGDGLIEAYDVHFEYWALDALREIMVRDAGLLAWLAPRMHPAVRLEGDTLHISPGQSRATTATQRKLLAVCDGTRTAGLIAARLAADPAHGFGTAHAVFSELQRLSRFGAVIWTLALPVTLHAERYLRAALQRVQDERVRRPAIDLLDRFESARDAVTRARGNARAVDTALARLESLFTEVTERSPTHDPGKAYRGRSLLYHDTRRDVDVSFGRAILDALSRPLSLVLTSARWVTYTVATRFMDYLRHVYNRLSGQTGEVALPLQDILRAIAEEDLVDDIAEDVAGELVERWSALLSWSPGERRVGYRCAQIANSVEEIFAAPGPGWPSARFHSPDLLIAGKDVEAIRRGQFQLVLGELHAGVNTLMKSLFVATHPEPQRLLAALQADKADSELSAVISRRRAGHRGAIDSLAPQDLHFATGDTPSWRAADQVLPIGDLVMEKISDRLVVRTRNSGWQLSAHALFAGFLGHPVATRFRLLACASHVPRITLDRLVVVRESWRFPIPELPFVQTRDAAERFIQARHFVRTHGLPRRVFVQTPIEPKPVYIDFSSPLYVDLLAKIGRQGADGVSSVMTISEMLPEPGQAWLVDADERRYTSELRMVAVDPRPWSAP